MYTQCPQCETLFRIGAEQLAQASGRVRCGLCAHCFNALESLSERPEPARRRRAAPPEEAPVAEAAAAPSAAVLAEEREPPAAEIEYAPFIPPPAGAETAAETQSDSVTTAANHADTAHHLPDAVGERGDFPPLRLAADEGGLAPPWIAAEPAHGRREPNLGPSGEEADAVVVDISAEARNAASPPPTAAVRRQRAGGAATALWAAANVALIFILLGQYGYFHRDELAQYPELRPWLSRLCAVAACEVPLQKDVSRIGLVNRVVQSHPQQENALLIDATLVNDAGFTQPYPVVELRFSDLSNRPVAGRRFRPEEYLAPGVNIPQGMTPNEPVHFMLEIADPGKDAVSFQFNLL